MLFDTIRRLLKNAYYQFVSQQQGLEDVPVERSRPHKRTRWYFYNPAFNRDKRLIVFLSGVVLVGVFLFSAGQLIGYGVDYAKAKRASDELRQAYYDSLEMEEPTAQPIETPQVVITAEPTAEPVLVQAAQTALPEASATATATPVQRLEKLKYPGNPYNVVSDRFQKLRRQNQDIVGWLTIEDMIDEGVVQRDNEYYLDRDYRGYHNVNGAIFLDENCDLRTRPYTLMLYGHNMKTGLMFGSLRNYENPTFYHKNPFITFDTLYENGRYVVFSVSTVSLDSTSWRFVNLAWLLSSSAELRTKGISSLNRFSIYHSGIDVKADDQLLLLITCVDEPTDRRIIAARRLRDNEEEENLRRVVRTIRLK